MPRHAQVRQDLIPPAKAEEQQDTENPEKEAGRMREPDRRKQAIHKKVQHAHT